MPNKPTNWEKEIQILLDYYKSTKHPLAYNSIYELVVMVILSAQDSDRNINQLAPALFKAFPNMTALANATEETLMPFIAKVRNFGNKMQWLIKLANEIKNDKNIPLEMEKLVALPGIGRKSANVIRREAKQLPEGVIVDLHVVRVAPRLGISKATNPIKIEKEIMESLPQNQWDAGMAISFLGREICRPSQPKCDICIMAKVCEYRNSQ